MTVDALVMLRKMNSLEMMLPQSRVVGVTIL
jgi:hypothetical protein